MPNDTQMTSDLYSLLDQLDKLTWDNITLQLQNYHLSIQLLQHYQSQLLKEFTQKYHPSPKES